MPTPASPWRGTCLPSIRRPAVVAEAELRSCRWPAGAHAECQQATAMRERSRSQAISSRPRSTTASHRARSETHRGVWRSGIGAPAARSAPWRWSRSTRSSGWTSKPTAPWSSERSGATATAGNARGRCEFSGHPDPQAQLLATDACEPPRLARGQVLISRPGRVVALDPARASRDVLVHGLIPLTDLDEAGGRLAYALPSCNGDTTLHLVGVSAPRSSAGGVACPLAIPGQRGGGCAATAF